MSGKNLYEKYYSIDDNIVLLSPEFILIGLNENESDLLITGGCSVDLFDPENVIRIDSLNRIESISSDDLIIISQLNEISDEPKIILMKKGQREAFIKELYEIIKDDFDYVEEKTSHFANALVPLIKSIVILFAGVCLIIAILKQQIEVNNRLLIGKKYFFYKLYQMIGPTNSLILLGLVFLFYLFQIVKKLRTPQFNMIIKRK